MYLVAYLVMWYADDTLFKQIQSAIGIIPSKISTFSSKVNFVEINMGLKIKANPISLPWVHAMCVNNEVIGPYAQLRDKPSAANNLPVCGADFFPFG